MRNPARFILYVLITVFAVFFVWNSLNSGGSLLSKQPPMEYTSSQFLADLADKDQHIIKTAEWQQTKITGERYDGKKYSVTVPEPNSPAAARYQEALQTSGATWNVMDPPVSQGMIALLSVLIVPILIIAIFYFMVFRPAQAGGNQAMNFGRSRAKRVGETGIKVTFEDVGGIDEAKQELFEVVDFLKNTKKYTALGAKIPKGILLTGSPGVGKTHIARAVAGEAGVPFFHISGSDFVEMFVGVGAARVRDLFETAKAHRPSLVFVDEIDAVGRQRGAGLGGGHDEREQTLNQLLVEMDGFDPNSGVILIAATNRPDVLDPALLRPGRFDRQIVVDVPDQNGREAILKIHSKNKPFDTDVDMSVIAKRTPGFTGADLANTLNEAALLAARNGHSKIRQSDIEEALDRVIAGPQRRSRVIDGKEREVIAYHEAGHAVIGELLEHSDPVHKVTILPRGMSLGSTWQLPDADKFLVSQQELVDDITGLLGGRVAEEVVYGEVWTGASNDLERVTRIARAMVCKYGMSSKLGTLALGSRSDNPFLGRDYHEDRNYSEDVAKLIDDEVRHIVDTCHQRARDLLTTHRDSLDRLVAALLERETLNREEFLIVMKGEDLPPYVKPGPDQNQTPTPGSAERNGVEAGKPQAGPPRFEPGPA